MASLEVGYLADINGVTIVSIDRDSVTVDLGHNHFVTLNKDQVSASLKSTGVLAPVKESQSINASEVGSLESVLGISASESGLPDSDIKSAIG